MGGPVAFPPASLGSRLDSPPPLPGGLDPMGGAPPQPPAGMGAPAPAQGPGPGVAAPGAGLMQIGQQLQEGILALAQALPDGASDFYQALEAVKRGLARGVESQIAIGAPPPTATPTATGVQFPGGGIGGGGFR